MSDLRAADGDPNAGLGPIAQAVSQMDFHSVEILSDHPSSHSEKYHLWLAQRYKGNLTVREAKLTRPTEFGEIYRHSSSILAKTAVSESAQRVFHLSPGTPAMAAVWIILSKTRFPAELIESSQHEGVRAVDFPFDLSAEFIPELLRKSDESLERLSSGQIVPAPEFGQIVYRSPEMHRLLEKSRLIAIRNVPVLIQGESGTGKELLARAIHAASLRRDRPFVAVNCGAIPESLIDSELFGHVRGAFTGAVRDRVGYFQAAYGGTLFLDEIGELPKHSQVRLLRVIQEKLVTPVGSTEPVAVDVRIISATNRNLIAEVPEGNFREDLFHRLAVGIVNLPPLRERTGDIGLLIDEFVKRLNDELAKQPGFASKELSPSARNVLLKHYWPGNIRELQNTLTRLMAWSTSTYISEKEVRESLLPLPTVPNSVLQRQLGDGFDIRETLEDVTVHYLKRSLAESGGNKSLAARLLGLPNYQTLDNWIRKYRITQ